MLNKQPRLCHLSPVEGSGLDRYARGLLLLMEVLIHEVCALFTRAQHTRVKNTCLIPLIWGPGWKSLCVRRRLGREAESWNHT